MTTNNLLSPTLDRIFKRMKLDKNNIPTDIAQWQDFITRINNHFLDLDQERYLIERSMEISSREMLELNERYETAQAIAHIGYWLYNPRDNKMLWSKETYRIFGLDQTLPAPNLKEFLQLLPRDDRDKFRKLIERTLKTGQNFVGQFRINNITDKKQYWIYTKAQLNKKIKKKPAEENTYDISGIFMDITLKKQTDEELEKLNQSLVTYARQAGMSEIATTVLHNVGNVLNSVNTAITMIQEIIKRSEINNLKRISEMLAENLRENPTYLTTDPKGKIIPNYLSVLALNLQNEYAHINTETHQLIENFQHIRDIIVTQNDISVTKGQEEKVVLTTLIDSAIQLSCASPEKYGIQIIKKVSPKEVLLTDKPKLLQILVNLIINAKEAFTNKNKLKNIITINVLKSTTPGYIEISVQDNGCGIEPSVLTKIFSMGFTTKQKGHGFGLHSSAIAARQLGGNLTVKSNGSGQGAQFILKLPKTDMRKNKKVQDLVEVPNHGST